MGKGKTVKTNQKQEKLNFRVSPDEKAVFFRLARVNHLTVSGLIKLSVAKFEGDILPDYLQELRNAFASKVIVDIKKEIMRLDAFYGFLPKNTVELIKNVVHISLRINHGINMDQVKNAVKNAFSMYSSYPKKNQDLIKLEMKTIDSLVDEEMLWGFLCSRFPHEFNKKMRHVEPEKPKFTRRKHKSL